MELAKFTVIALVLAARMCRGEIVIGTSTPDESTVRLVDDLVNIVTSCYKGQINNGVGLAGNLPSTLIRRLTVQHLIPVSLIDNIRNFNDKSRPVDLRFRQKRNVFIIEASSFEKLKELIEMNIKKSIWWNHMASFFILDLSDGCLNATNYMCGAWQSDLLNAYMMCRHKNRTIILSYNPFTSRALVPWKLFKVYPSCRKRKDIRHPFTVVSQVYRKNETVCADLNYDKTQDLGGYMIRLQGYPYDYTKTTEDFRGHGAYAYLTTRKRILATVFHALNATARVYSVNTTCDVHENNHMSNVECWLVQTSQVGRRMATYPRRYVMNRIVTQFRGHRSQLNAVMNIFDKGTLIGMLVVYLITLIFFKLFVRQSLDSVLLNLIRMTFGMGFTNLPDNTVSRIYLASLFIFAVVMQGFFQSDTTCLLTSQITLPHAESIEDLEDLGYKQICALPYKNIFFVGSALESKFYGTWDLNDCIIRVRNDSSVAFIDVATGPTFDAIKKFDFRVSREPIECRHLAFAMQWDYPLTERINQITARMFESNVFEPWNVKCNPVKLSDLYVDSTDKNYLKFEILNLNHMTFAFAVLGIGLLCATFVFIIELAVGYYNVRYTCRLPCYMIPATRRDSIPPPNGTEMTVGRLQIE